MFLSTIGKFFNNVGGFDRSILGITCDGTISSASGKYLWTSSPINNNDYYNSYYINMNHNISSSIMYTYITQLLSTTNTIIFKLIIFELRTFYSIKTIRCVGI